MSVENVERLINVLVAFGFSRASFDVQDFTSAYRVLQLGHPPFRIDIITSVDGVVFEECYQNSVEFEVDKLTINIIGLDDLRKNKRVSGRAKGMLDLENLV